MAAGRKHLLSMLDGDDKDVVDGRVPCTPGAVGQIYQVDMVATRDEVVGPAGLPIGLCEPVLVDISL